MHIVQNHADRTQADLVEFLAESQGRIQPALVAQRRNNLRRTLAGLMAEGTNKVATSGPEAAEPVGA